MNINKAAVYTDIHFGKKNNSIIHNQDCLDFIDWFCDNVKKIGDITHILFLGDFFENRSDINILTLNMAYEGLKKLHDLGLPIIHIVGNHDLHKRTSRDIHSVNIFNEFDNIQVIDEITQIGNSLFIPYIFEDEYKELTKYDVDYWYGHLEFKNFMITGYNTIMKQGPDHTLFNKPKYIFSGHFHKRQATDNVVYIGNTFQMDRGDANDLDRGMMIFDSSNDKVEFLNWNDMPKYLKTSLSKIVNNEWEPSDRLIVDCLVDIDLSHSEANDIKTNVLETYNIREFNLIEDPSVKEALEEGKNEEILIGDINTEIVNMISTINADSIKSDKLTSIYQGLS